MTRAQLILWPGVAGPNMPWSLWEGGRCIGEGSGSDVADAVAAIDPAPMVTAIVPAADVPLYRVELPVLAPAQARAAALLIATENAAAPPASLHVALGARDASGAHVAAVSSIDAMEHWILRCAVADFTPDRILPSSALLPEPEAGFTAATIGSEPVLRGRECAMTDEPATRLIVGDAEVVAVTLPPLDLALDAAAVDLAQGRFAPRRRLKLDKRRLCRVAFFCLTALLLWVSAGAVELIRLRQAAAALEGRAVAVAYASLPGTGIREPLAQLRAASRARGTGSRELLAMLGALQRGLARTPDAALVEIAWGEGTLSATITAPAPETIAGVVAVVRGAGYTLPDVALQPGVEGQRAELRISR